MRERSQMIRNEWKRMHPQNNILVLYPYWVLLFLIPIGERIKGRVR